ncbi:Gfo/Idh/MocA family protein [Rubritalea spongiae]|uniref:Gfo/Idh/MocA family protein n=1 Tax=Rubritalea spongiae TaxID=430797 RepID=A0ABW5E5H1_9BACT
MRAGLATSFAHGAAAERKKLGWALVGLSRLSASRIAPALLKTQHAHLIGIVTGTKEKAAEWQKKYGIADSGVYDYDSLDRIVENPAIDVVFIVLPNSMYCEFALRAAKAGKHVFMEKPMATSSEECRKMIAASEEAGVKLGMGYQLQFEPYHIEAIRFANDEVFGKVQHMEAGFGVRMRGGDEWRLKKAMGGGDLLGLGVCVIQAARYIFGEEPSEVSAMETKTDPNKFSEVDETITWMMRFPSGKTANLYTSFNMPGYNRLTVFAEKGRFGIEPCFAIGKQRGWTSDTKVPFEFPQTDHFEVQMDLFSESILQGKEWKVDGSEGLKDHLVMDAIFQSIQSGKVESVGKA